MILKAQPTGFRVVEDGTPEAVSEALRLMQEATEVWNYQVNIRSYRLKEEFLRVQQESERLSTASRGFAGNDVRQGNVPQDDVSPTP